MKDERQLWQEFHITLQLCTAPAQSHPSPQTVQRGTWGKVTSLDQILSLFIAVSDISICRVNFWEYLWPQIQLSVGCARDGQFWWHQLEQLPHMALCTQISSGWVTGLCILCHNVTQPSAVQHLGVQIKSLFLQLLPLPSCPVGLLWHMWSVFVRADSLPWVGRGEEDKGPAWHCHCHCDCTQPRPSSFPT